MLLLSLMDAGKGSEREPQRAVNHLILTSPLFCPSCLWVSYHGEPSGFFSSNCLIWRRGGWWVAGLMLAVGLMVLDSGPTWVAARMTELLQDSDPSLGPSQKPRMKFSVDFDWSWAAYSHPLMASGGGWMQLKQLAVSMCNSLALTWSWVWKSSIQNLRMAELRPCCKKLLVTV